MSRRLTLHRDRPKQSKSGRGCPTARAFLHGFPQLITPYGALPALLALLGLFLVASCSKVAPQRLSDAERRQIAGRFREAIEQTGGVEVWIKEPPYAPFPRHAGAVEVVVESSSFDRVVSVIEGRAEREGLAVRRRVSQGEEKMRLADLRLTRGRDHAGHWLLREVRQLRYAAVVIDDLGQDLDAARKLLTFPYPLTFSVLPHLRHSAVTAEEAHRAGREVMLHLPMEPLPDSPVGPGVGEVKVGMSEAEVSRILEQNMATVPYARGVNNHMGSRATADPALMEAVMRHLSERDLYFVDSRTTGATVALDAARRRGIPTFYRSVFLDGTDSLPYTLGQLHEFRRVIEKQGAAIAIGHPYPTTLAALERFLPELERADIRVLPASELLHLPEVAQLVPVN
ncbi:MAG: divergent polysaccharide deacetylase family protein [Acidobacteria bacterium]|nr:divergent polysaccharide deacetylase family protein [Acidobacteriota bacterium]